MGKRGNIKYKLKEDVTTTTSDNKAAVTGFNAAENSTARSLVFYPTNSYIEHSSYNRIQITQKVRALEANLGIIKRLVNKISLYAVGKGIFVRPVTDDTAWNEAALRYFEDWAENPNFVSIDGSIDLYDSQRMAAESLVSDGEYFAVKVNDPITGHPKIQPVDVFEVSSPIFLDGADRFVDGVRVNAFGKPISYALQEFSPNSAINTKLREIPANNMLHVMRQRRAKQVRGLSWFYTGINQGIDALDTRALISGTAKLHAALAITYKTKDGTATGKGFGGAVAGLGQQNYTPNTANIDKVFGGGLTQYLRDGEEIKLLSSDRPSENQLDFLKFLYADISIALGLPLEVIYSLADLNGTAVRGVLEDAQQLFDQVADIIIYKHTLPLYRWVIAWAMKHGKIPICKDKHWYRKVTFRGPAKITVDLGRTAKANIDLLQNGLLSYTRYYDERGLEAKTEILDQINMIAWIKEECLKKGVPLEMLMKVMQTEQSINRSLIVDDADDEDEEEEN